MPYLRHSYAAKYSNDARPAPKRDRGIRTSHVLTGSVCARKSLRIGPRSIQAIGWRCMTKQKPIQLLSKAPLRHLDRIPSLSPSQSITLSGAAGAGYLLASWILFRIPVCQGAQGVDQSLELLKMRSLCNRESNRDHQLRTNPFESVTPWLLIQAPVPVCEWWASGGTPGLGSPSIQWLCPRNWLSIASPNRCGMNQADGAESDLGHYPVDDLLRSFLGPVEIARCPPFWPNQIVQLKALWSFPHRHPLDGGK